MKPIVLIPAYKPQCGLCEIVRQLFSLGISRIVVVNDGSGSMYDDVFAALAHMDGVDIIRHGANRGKGAALRTGLRYILESFPDAAGVVTVDADGQHLPGDVLNVYQTLERQPGRLILGCRRFDTETPLRSYLGNACTRLIFRAFMDVPVSDTQTGLRGIPAEILPWLLSLPAERYAYELEMLLMLMEKGYPIAEVPIETVYLEDNASSHFHPIRDSFRIYSVLLLWLIRVRLLRVVKYSLTGMLSTVVDFGIYGALIYLMSATIPQASIVARFFSVITHFTVNKYFTFNHRSAPQIEEVLKYLGVVAFNLFFSILLIEFCVAALGMEKVFAKVVAQLLLFLFTYFLLSRFVFLGRRKQPL